MTRIDGSDSVELVKTLILLHGYGVRSFFWDSLRPPLAKNFSEVVTPDVAAESFEAYVDEAERLSIERSEADGRPVAIMGHSLGALVAAAAALRVGKEGIGCAVLVAPPGPSQHDRINPLLRFLLRRRLIPDFLIRPRFFLQTAPSVQKRIFKRVVVEPKGLQDDVYLRRSEIAAKVTGPMPQRALVVCSDADAIVPASASLALAEQLQADVHRFDQSQRIGHDDYAAAPAAVLQIAELVSDFCNNAESSQREDA